MSSIGRTRSTDRWISSAGNNGSFRPCTVSNQRGAIGLTATPKETCYVSNIHYFGEPVYTYSLMSSVRTPVSDMLVTVESREVQRGMLAGMGNQQTEARRHFLAAAHLELVLAFDYEQAGDADLARRGRISAASCFWRAGDPDRARTMFDELIQEAPGQADEIREIIEDLEHHKR